MRIFLMCLQSEMLTAKSIAQELPAFAIAVYTSDSSFTYISINQG